MQVDRDECFNRTCPITLEKINDAYGIKLSDGQCYDAEAISEWYKGHENDAVQTTPFRAPYTDEDKTKIKKYLMKSRESKVRSPESELELRRIVGALRPSIHPPSRNLHPPINPPINLSSFLRPPSRNLHPPINPPIGGSRRKRIRRRNTKTTRKTRKKRKTCKKRKPCKRR